MPVKLTKIKQCRRGNGNEYQFGQTIFRISRQRDGFFVYNKSIGNHCGQEIFRMFGFIHFNYGMREFKTWLEKSRYATIKS